MQHLLSAAAWEFQISARSNCWLVVYLPLWKIWVRQLGWLFPIYGKIKNVPNHQPELEETTKAEHSCSITLKTDRIRQTTHLHSAESQEKKILGDICNGYVLEMCALRLYHTVSISNMSECLNIGNFPNFPCIWRCGHVFCPLHGFPKFGHVWLQSHYLHVTCFPILDLWD